MTYIRTLATSTYQGGQKRIDFKSEAARKTVICEENITAEGKKNLAIAKANEAKATAASVPPQSAARIDREFGIGKAPKSAQQSAEAYYAHFAKQGDKDLKAAQDAHREAQRAAAQARKGFKGHVTGTCPFEPFKGAKIPVTPETAEWWRSFGYKDVNPTPGPKPPAPIPGPKPPVPAPIPNPPAPIPPGPKPTPKPGFFGKLGKFAKKLGKWGLPLALLAGAAYMLKDCKGCSSGTPVAPTNNCKATAKEDVTQKEIKNIAYKMQAGDRLDKVIEAKYGIKDAEQNKKVREYIREQMGLPKSGQDASGKTVIPKITQNGKTVYDAYYFPEQLPKELGGAKYQDDKVQKSKLQKADGSSQEAKNKTRIEKTSNGYSVITTCKNADGSTETSVAASGLTKEEADKIVKDMNK